MRGAGLSVVAALSVVASPLSAQVDRDPVTGLREVATVVEEKAFALDGTRRSYFFTVTPGMIRTDGRTAYTGSFTILSGRVIPAVPLQARMTYRSINPDAGTRSERLDVQGKILTPDASVFRKPFATSLVADYKRTLSSATRIELKMANGLTVLAGTKDSSVASLSLDSEIGYLRSSPEGGRSVEDFRFIPGVTIKLGAITLGGGYAFKNEVDGRDDWTAAFSTTLELSSTKIQPRIETGKGNLLLVSVSFSL